MTAPDPTWVEAVARALHARYCTCGSPDRIERRNAGIAVAAVEPLIREQIAQQIEAQPIDAWGSQAPRGPVTFARREAQLRSARIARGDDG